MTSKKLEEMRKPVPASAVRDEKRARALELALDRALTTEVIAQRVGTTVGAVREWLKAGGLSRPRGRS